MLVFLESQDFVDRLQSRELRNLLTNLKNSYPGYTIILLIEGMEKYYRNLKKDVNKQFQAAMRRVSGGANSSSFDATTERPDQAFIENVIMQLQFDQDVRVQFSKDSADSSEWIGNICKEVAVIPEQRYPFFDNMVVVGPIRPLILPLATSLPRARICPTRGRKCS